MSGELERAAAACLFPGFEGTAAPDWVLRWVERGLGGVVLFGGNIESHAQVRGLTRRLRGEGDLLVATDEEGGDVTRLESRTGSSYPGNWALGAVDDVDLTEQTAASIANELAAVGINFDFAPVADVNSNPDNPVIGVRSFGSEPSLVARHVAAFVKGLQGQGIAACAKHFPGHGDTSQDSHLELPVVGGDLDEALEPFRAATDAGVRSVMTAHVRVPALDDEQATLSPRILQELLREELGFAGVAITDALEMRAVSATVGVEEGAVRALAAGADALCLGAEVDNRLVESTHGSIIEAVRSGRLAEERLVEAAGRVAQLGAWARTPRTGAAKPGLGAETARRALEVIGDVRLSDAPLVLELRPPASIAAGEPELAVGDLLGASETIVLVEGVPAPASPSNGRPLVIVVRDAHRHQWERDAVERLLRHESGAVVVELGLPVWRPEDALWIGTLGSGRANLEAAAEALQDRTGDL
ncbi:MAG TPA: glycoside hydrolase family 3 N-terminal domain-containing protein [Gaiellaceae bacterium]|nr:glycoside hydrolase family 3 N-terminal domain-containing protein [Gaiellaceae bacterium]